MTWQSCLKQLDDVELQRVAEELKNRWLSDADSHSLPSTSLTDAGDGSSTSSRGDLDDPYTPSLAPAAAPGQLEFPADCTAANLDAVSCGVQVQHVDEFVRVQWTENAKRLNGKDHSIVSSSFEVKPGVFLTMMLKPGPKVSECGGKKGQACFKKAKGEGFVHLKLQGTAQPLRLAVRIGLGSDSSGPEELDFSDVACLRLQKVWKFADYVDNASSTFTIVLDVQALPEHVKDTSETSTDTV
jgi:hypothetical protein